MFCLAFVLRHEAEGFSNELWVFDFSYKVVKWVVGLFTGFVFIISEDFIQLPVHNQGRYETKRVKKTDKR